MKRKTALLLICAFTFVTSHALGGSKLSKEIKPAYKALLKATYFAIGKVYYDGVISENEKALELLLNEENSIPVFQELLTKATVEGQMYALLGLSEKDQSLYVKEVSAYKARNKKPREVTVQDGCETETLTDLEIIRRIESGTYARKV